MLPTRPCGLLAPSSQVRIHFGSSLIKQLVNSACIATVRGPRVFQSLLTTDTRPGGLGIDEDSNWAEYQKGSKPDRWQSPGCWHRHW